MRFSAASATLALAAGANAWGNGTVSYTTKVVSKFETYCPSATQLTFNGVTYTVTSATTIKILNCPCTITTPVSAIAPPTSTPVVVVPSVSVTPVAPVVPAVSTAVVSYTTVPAVTPAASVPVAPIAPPPAVSTAVVVPPPVVANATVPAAGTGSPATPAVSPSISAFKGAGNRVAASGASLAAVMGLAAFLL